MVRLDLSRPEATTTALGKLIADPSPEVRNAALRALASYAKWRSAAAQQVLIQRATDQSLDLDARLDAADGLAQAVKLQATGVQQDPPTFRVMVSLTSEKNEPLRAEALLALAPIRPYIVGGAVVNHNPAQAFQSTLQAAQRGYVPAEEVVGMMYAIGKGVQQDYHEAGKWFLTAAEAGNTRAAINYVGSLRSGMGNLRRDPELTARWAKFLLAHPEYSPVPGR